MSFELRLRHRIGRTDIAIDTQSDAPLIALAGPSGVGKTTTLNCIAGLIRPDAGRIAVGGTVLFDSEAGVDLPPEARRAGYVFQQGRLFPHMRVGANLAYGEKLADPEDRWIGRAEVLEFLGIGQLLDRIESSNCSFGRNGSWHPPAEARKHLQMKIDYMVKRNMLGSTEEFISKAATASSISGQAYQIRCGGAEPMPSAVWLTAELKRIRAAY